MQLIIMEPLEIVTLTEFNISVATLFERTLTLAFEDLVGTPPSLLNENTTTRGSARERVRARAHFSPVSI